MPCLYLSVFIIFSFTTTKEGVDKTPVEGLQCGYFDIGRRRLLKYHQQR
jgi:hypothetical protein